MATTTLHLSADRNEIVRDALLAEIRFQVDAVQEDIRYEPIEPHHLADVEWKLRRLQSIIDLLEKLGYLNGAEEAAN